MDPPAQNGMSKAVAVRNRHGPSKKMCSHTKNLYCFLGLPTGGLVALGFLHPSRHHPGLLDRSQLAGVLQPQQPRLFQQLPGAVQGIAAENGTDRVDDSAWDFQRDTPRHHSRESSM